MHMTMTLREWQGLVKTPVNDYIVQASTMDGRDKWQRFPIGMQLNFRKAYMNHGLAALQLGNHEHLVFGAINDATDQRRRGHSQIHRKAIIQTCEKQLGITNQMIDAEAYFLSLPTYKFVLSPEGNGIDCHRHYEALFAGCIPIVEKHPGIMQKYAGCPVLYTTDYSELTPEFLEETYQRMLDDTFDFSRLFLSYYDQLTQFYIKFCGNFWMTRCTGAPFYN
jgi:hypothetical protein